MSNIVEMLIQGESIQQLVEHGYGQLVEALLSNEGKVYTKKG